MRPASEITIFFSLWKKLQKHSKDELDHHCENFLEFTKAFSDWVLPIRINCVNYNCLNYNCLNYSCLNFNCLNYNCLNYNCLNYNCLNYNCLNYNCLNYNCLNKTSPNYCLKFNALAVAVFGLLGHLFLFIWPKSKTWLTACFIQTNDW
jgi:hypothetical protein